jgi:peroxiredoxin
LRDYYPAFRELNAEILVVSAAGRKPLAVFAHELGLPFPILSDARGKAYRAFGLGQEMELGGPALWLAGWLAQRERRPYWSGSDAMHVGGDFIVDATGILRYAHSSEDPTERPEASELLRLIEASSA